MPRLSADLSYAADLRIATSSLMTPDQKMDLLLTRHARRKLKVKLREVRVEYELSKAGVSTSKAGVPTSKAPVPIPAPKPVAKAILAKQCALPQPKPSPPARSLSPTPEFDMRDSEIDAEVEARKSRPSSPVWSSSSSSCVALRWAALSDAFASVCLYIVRAAAMLNSETLSEVHQNIVSIILPYVIDHQFRNASFTTLK